MKRCRCPPLLPRGRTEKKTAHALESKMFSSDARVPRSRVLHSHPHPAAACATLCTCKTTRKRLIVCYAFCHKQHPFRLPARQASSACWYPGRKKKLCGFIKS